MDGSRAEWGRAEAARRGERILAEAEGLRVRVPSAFTAEFRTHQKWPFSVFRRNS